VLASWKRGNEEARLAAWRKSLLDNNAQATVLLDQQGRITAMSAAARRLLDEPRKESLREPALKIPRNTSPAGDGRLRGAQRLTHLFQDADQLRIATWCARALAGTSDRRVEPRHGPAELPEALLRNGVRVRLRPALPAGGRFAAVTLEKCAETQHAPQASRAESELTSVLEWLDEGVILFDAQDHVRALNSRFLQITGLQAADAAGLRDLDSLIARLSPRIAGPANFVQRWRNLARGIDGGIREELEFVGPSPRIVQRMSRPILDGHGRRLGRVEIYLDLSGRRGFQSKLLRTEKLAALGQLVTGIAHELSSPLTSILGYSQVLLQKEASGPSEDIRQVRHIFEEAERATAILRQLLSNAHERKPELGAVPINQLVLQGLELQRLSLAQEHIRVETDLDPSGPLVYGDQGQLQQVFLTLMGNARQSLDQSGKHGHIRIRTRQIGDQRVLLEIADDGPGIPQEIMGRIFDPFFTTKPAGIGTGLGLAIVSGIVREHGGHVNVASPPGGGAIFSVALMAANPSSASNFANPVGERMLFGYVGGAPAPFPVADLSVLRPEPAAVAEFSRKRGHRILVVEDEPTVARLIADVLEDEGFHVDVLLDGQEALKQAARETYDLVICDMKMPGLDGQHFYKALVQAGNALSKRFLFVTGDIVAQQTQQFLEAHRLPHVAKPFRMEELKGQVYAVLDHNLHRQPDAAGAAKNG
jgi:signal transduction histidine kinase